MREKILNIIEKNSRIEIKELAVLLGEDEILVANELKAMEDAGIICGYHTMIDWEKTNIEKVSALISILLFFSIIFKIFSLITIYSPLLYILA